MIGIAKTKIVCNGEELRQDIFIVKNQPIPLLGRPVLQEFKAIQLIEEVNNSEDKYVKMFPNVFNGLGKFERKYPITLKKNYDLFSVAAPKRIAHALRDAVEKEIKNMVNDGIVNQLMNQQNGVPLL